MTKSARQIAAFAFGVFFLIGLIWLAIAFPDSTGFQYTVFRAALALASAGCAAMIPGFVNVQLVIAVPSLQLIPRALRPRADRAQPWRRCQVQAWNLNNWVKTGGALAVFAIVYSYNPAQQLHTALVDLLDARELCGEGLENRFRCTSAAEARRFDGARTLECALIAEEWLRAIWESDAVAEILAASERSPQPLAKSW